ncbi:iron chaperone [Lactiplantibacillus plantarum]
MEEMPMAEYLDTDLAVLTPYLEKLGATPHRAQLITLLNWVHTTFPQLKARVAWNQPMFTGHNTFIIGFSTAKDHLNIALESHTLDSYRNAITAAGDKTTKMLWQVAFDAPINHKLLAEIIQYNMTTKQTMTTFWRP